MQSANRIISTFPFWLISFTAFGQNDYRFRKLYLFSEALSVSGLRNYCKGLINQKLFSCVQFFELLRTKQGLFSSSSLIIKGGLGRQLLVWSHGRRSFIFTRECGDYCFLRGENSSSYREKGILIFFSIPPTRQFSRIAFWGALFAKAYATTLLSAVSAIWNFSPFKYSYFGIIRYALFDDQ